MTIKHLTMKNYEEEIVNSNKPSVIDFYADWCGPCQMMKPVFEGLSKEFGNKINFLKLDTQSEEGLAMSFGVQGIPTLIFINKDKVIGRHVGFASEGILREKINTVLSSITK